MNHLLSTCLVALLATPALSYIHPIIISGLYEYNDTQTYTPTPDCDNTKTNDGLGGYRISPRVGAQAVALGNGLALFTGGSIPLGSGGQGGAVYQDVRLFSSYNGDSDLMPNSMLQSRFHHAMTVRSNGQVTVCGGQEQNGLIASCEQNDNPSDKSSAWYFIASLPVATSELTLTQTPVGLLAIGGRVGFASKEASKKVWAYDPNQNNEQGQIGSWKPAAQLLAPLRAFGAAQFPGMEITLLCGGFSTLDETAPQRQCYTFDPSGNGQWIVAGQLSRPRGYFSLVPWAYSGQKYVYAVGGTDGDGVSSDGLSIVSYFTDPNQDAIVCSTDLRERVQQAATVGIL